MASKKSTPIKIHLETEITQDGQTESHVFDEEGELIQMGTTTYLRYLEHVQGQETAVRFKLAEDGQVQLTRGTEKDATQLRLYFKMHDAQGSLYQTQYGNLPVLTTTNHLLMTLSDEPLSGEVVVHYQLEISQQVVGDYKLRLIFNA